MGREMSQQVDPGTPATTTFNILFVCTGNTCRSPLAEGIARREVERRGWQHVQVASAGIEAILAGRRVLVMDSISLIARGDEGAIIVCGSHGGAISVHSTPEDGTTFTLLASIGVVRMPDVYMRMQVSTKFRWIRSASAVVSSGIVRLMRSILRCRWQPSQKPSR